MGFDCTHSVGGNCCPRGCNYGNGADEDPQGEKKSDVCQRKWSY